MVLPRHVLGGNGFIAPSDRINLGYIGTGKQVYGLLRNIGKVPETMVVAACDVDRKKLAKFVGESKALNATKASHPVESYGDYRELLGRTDIDAGTRVGRFFLQEMLGGVIPRFRDKNWMPGILIASLLFTSSWGYLVYTGNVSSIWPLLELATNCLRPVR